MNLDEVRKLMTAKRVALLADATRSRDPNLSYPTVIEMFRDVASTHPEAAEKVVQEWLQSLDAGTRMHAMAIVAFVHMVSAIPVLEQVSSRLEREGTPLSVSDSLGVQDLIARLQGTSAAGGSDSDN